MSGSELEQERYGAATVLYGDRRGRYPEGNSVWVEGREESAMLDPSLGLLPRRDALPPVDRVIGSHCHEDHLAGLHLFPDVPLHLHEADLPGIQDLDRMMAIYGYGGEIEAAFRVALVEQFHYTPRPDALGYRDGDVFDLGGTTITVVHAPGHTRGHSCLLIEGGGDPVLFLADIDLSSFGPYYGDAWSDLEDFERSLARVRDVEARWYATFHHIGVVDRAVFLERLERFAARIADREQRLLEYLEEPRSLDEIAEHRFVYRPADPVPFASAVERRSMGLHLERLERKGAVTRPDPDRWRAR